MWAASQPIIWDFDFICLHVHTVVPLNIFLASELPYCGVNLCEAQKYAAPCLPESSKSVIDGEQYWTVRSYLKGVNAYSYPKRVFYLAPVSQELPGIVTWSWKVHMADECSVWMTRSLSPCGSTVK